MFWSPQSCSEMFCPAVEADCCARCLSCSLASSGGGSVGDYSDCAENDSFSSSCCSSLEGQPGWFVVSRAAGCCLCCSLSRFVLVKEEMRLGQEPSEW